MINIIRGIIKDIAGLVSTTAYRVYEAYGRPDEVIRGRLYQHYGFRSVPPKGVEVLTMQQGNNNFSVAEMDGQGIATSSELDKGDSLLYSADDNFIVLTNRSDISFSVAIQSNKEFLVTSDKDIDIGSTEGEIIITSDKYDITLNAVEGDVFIGGKSFVGIRSDEDIEINGTTTVGKGPVFQVVATKAFLDAVLLAYNSHTHVATSGGGTTATPLPLIVETPTMKSADTKVS